MRYLLKSMTASALLLLAVSCGRASDEANSANTSKTMSLVGFPCQEYGVNITDSQYHCAVYTTGARAYNVLFRLDGFNDAQKAKLKEAIDIGARNYNAYWTEAALNANTDPALLQCIERNANREMDPLNSKLSVGFTDSKRKIIWAITSLQFGFDYHQSKGVPIVVSAYNEPRDGNVAPLAHAIIGNDAIPSNLPLDFGVNLASLSKPDVYSYSVGPDNYVINYSANTFAGALIHEMLHRKGYTHADPGFSVGPLVYEFGNCISNSSYGLSLSSFTPIAID